MDISEISRSSKVLIDGVPYSVEEINFVKPGKGQGIYKMRLRNLFSGNVLERNYRSGDKLDEARITAAEMQYLYQEGDQYVFMDTGTFEQIYLNKELVGNKSQFFKEGSVCTVLMLDDRPIDLQIPNFIELKVVKSEVGIKSATVTAQFKMAVLETGASIEVPIFIKEGDIIKVDTRSGNYIERVGTAK